MNALRYHIPIHRLLPARLRASIRERAFALIRLASTPVIVYGYTNPGGNHCPNTRLSSSAVLDERARITLEDNVFIGHHVLLDGSGGLTVRVGAQIAASAIILSHSSHLTIRLYGRHYLEEGDKKGFVRKHTTIGRYSFIGAGSIILPGVTIGDGCIVSANSLVSRDVPDFGIVRGSPAVLVGDTIELDRDWLEDPELRAMYDEWVNG